MPRQQRPVGLALVLAAAGLLRADASDVADAADVAEEEEQQALKNMHTAHLFLFAFAFVVMAVGVAKGRAFCELASKMAAGENLNKVSASAVRLGAFSTLVALQSTAILLFKVCQSENAYSFSPASSIAITELLKLCMAAFLHGRYVSSSGNAYFANVSPAIVANYAGLALLYTANNYITFTVHTIADPGSYTLGKSITPYLVAIVLRLTGEKLHELQWICVIVQCCSIAITQYNPCTSNSALPPRAYHLIALSACITATCSVWNQKVIKGFAVGVNLQNMIMYSFGSLIASVIYVASDDQRGFLEGYSALPAALILSQAFQGLAVTWVLKYADAIVKNFAGSAVMAILVVVSANFFDLETTPITWLGLVIVLVITYTYMNIATKLPQKKEAELPKFTPLLHSLPTISEASTATNPVLAVAQKSAPL